MRDPELVAKGGRGVFELIAWIRHIVAMLVHNELTLGARIGATSLVPGQHLWKPQGSSQASATRLD